MKAHHSGLLRLLVSLLKRAPTVSAAAMTVLTCAGGTVNGESGGLCGFWVQYCNMAGQFEEVSVSGMGLDCISFAAWKKHTNSDGFWLDYDIFGSHRGGAVGYDPTGQSFKLNEQQSTPATTDVVASLCQEEFPWITGLDLSPGASGGDLFYSVPELY